MCSPRVYLCSHYRYSRVPTTSRLPSQYYWFLVENYRHEPLPYQSSWFSRVNQVGPCKSPDNGHYPLSNGVWNPVHIWALSTGLVRMVGGGGGGGSFIPISSLGIGLFVPILQFPPPTVSMLEYF